jgi:phosphoglycerol transferase MdoB-like AlkP superfamily enzyme
MWKKLRDLLPASTKSILVRLGFVLGLMTITRILFFLYNYDSFNEVVLTDWFAGAWFDLATIGLLFMPFITFSSLPHAWQKNWIIKLVKICCFFVPTVFIVAMNLLDTAYYNFTLKRSTSDLFAIVSAGNDVVQLLGSFFADYWLLVLIFLALLYGISVFYKRTDLSNYLQTGSKGALKQMIAFVVLIGLSVLFGRGGFILKPIDSIDASLFTKPENTALVLNSPFTLIKSIGNEDLIEKTYFPPDELKRLFNPMHTSEPQHILPGNPNIVIIMLESFGNEWVGKFNHGESYTPFLDSLLDHCWYFEYGISNGKKSIEAVPTISASMPTLMDNPYISSGFSNNRLVGLPGILSKAGYSTAFYHGATNGSMRFNSFAAKLGYESYVGRYEYNNDAHFDKTWGILDEYFNPWTAKQISKLKQPFMANLFTLSSHHPYYVPPAWKNKVKKGPHPICKSIHYGDISLAKFFKQAKKEPWYKNTVFVLVADHTPSTNSALYSLRTKMYQIPIAFYDPTGRLKAKREKTIFQQADIMPTLLDLANIQTKYYSIGNSFYSKQPREGITYLEGVYGYFYHNRVLLFSNDKKRSLLDFTQSTKHPEELLYKEPKMAAKMEQRLKAIIQRYNSDLIHNQTIVQ